MKRVLPSIPNGVEVTSRYGEGCRYIFIQNFNQFSVEIELPIERMKLLAGSYDGTISSFETIVLKEYLTEST